MNERLLRLIAAWRDYDRLLEFRGSWDPERLEELKADLEAAFNDAVDARIRAYHEEND